MKVSELIQKLSAIDPDMKVCVVGMDGCGWSDFTGVEVKLLVEQANKVVCDYDVPDDRFTTTRERGVGEPLKVVCLY